MGNSERTVRWRDTKKYLSVIFKSVKVLNVTESLRNYQIQRDYRDKTIRCNPLSRVGPFCSGEHYWGD